MALPKVTIQVKNGALGQLVQSEDALCGLILQGIAASGLNLLVPKQITSLQDAIDLGIDAAYDTDNSVSVYRHIKDFYAEAQTGAKLWIMLVSQAVTLDTLVDKAESDYAVKLLDAADGKIRLLSIARNPAGGYSEDTATNEIDAEVVTAITNAHALGEEYATNFKPLRILLGATYYAGTVGDLVDLKTLDKNRVGVLLGDTVSGNLAAVGLLLGRLAAIPVQRNIGRVKSGSLAITSAYIGSATLEASEGDIASIHDKGFITLRRYVGKAGYFFTDDPTATAATDDYNSVARGRVIDKAIRLAYATFVEEILDEVEIDDQGRIATEKAKYYQAIIENQIDTAMTANGEISSVSVQVDAEQNVLSTNQICIELRIVPVGYAKEIVIKLGFDNPANS